MSWVLHMILWYGLDLLFSLVILLMHNLTLFAIYCNKHYLILPASTICSHILHNDFIATRNCRKNWVATWKYILSKRPTQYCLFYDYKRCVSSNLSIISLKIKKSICSKHTNNWKIGWNTPLKLIKQAILAWSFRQNTFPGCYPVFPAISSGDEVIVSPAEICDLQMS